MFRSIAEITVRSRIKQSNVSRQRQFLSWDRVQNIALIVSMEEVGSKNTLDKFIDSTKKHIEVFCVETASKAPSYADWHCYIRKDKNLLELPKKTLLNELSTKKFDLVINTCHETQLFPILLSTVLTAPLKCGNSNVFNCFDLTISKTEPYNLISYLDHVVKYMQMIKT